MINSKHICNNIFEGITDNLSCFKPSDANFESQVISKSCCFELVEVLYSQFSKSELNTPESSINKAYVGGEVKTGKELTMAITKYVVSYFCILIVSIKNHGMLLQKI